jgi:hypothetical protein
LNGRFQILYGEIKRLSSGYMKINILTLLPLTGLCFLWSCKKDNDLPNSVSYPKTYTEDVRSSVIGNSVTVYNLTYDDNDRLTSLTATPAPPVLSFLYQYPSSNQLTLDMYDHGNLSIHEIFWLNASSKVDSTFQFNDTGDSTSEKFIYDSNHLLVQQKEYNYYTAGAVLINSTSYSYDNLGNPVQSVDAQGNTTTFTYYSDLPYTLSIGQPYIPVSANFVKTQTVNSIGTTVTSTHYYSFDGNNRLIKDSASATGVDLIQIKSYSY